MNIGKYTRQKQDLQVWGHLGPSSLLAIEFIFLGSPLSQSCCSSCDSTVIGMPSLVPLCFLEPSQQLPEIFIVPAPYVKKHVEMGIAQHSCSCFSFNVVHSLFLVRTVWLQEIGCCCAARRGDCPVKFRRKSADSYLEWTALRSSWILRSPSEQSETYSEVCCRSCNDLIKYYIVI